MVFCKEEDMPRPGKVIFRERRSEAYLERKDVYIFGCKTCQPELSAVTFVPRYFANLSNLVDPAPLRDNIDHNDIA